MPDLRRENAQATAEPPSLIAALALKAEAFLGYSWLRKKLGVEPRSLARALRELAIDPSRMDDVATYKKQQARTAQCEALVEYEKRAHCDGFLSLPLGTHVRARWRTVSLRDYDGAVPEFALSHALEIKERVPTAEFEIEELRVEKRYDPFLIVRCGRERFYIDVWDERDFEQSNS